MGLMWRWHVSIPCFSCHNDVVLWMGFKKPSAVKMLSRDRTSVVDGSEV